MKFMLKNQAGFSPVLLLVIIVVAALVGVAGWQVQAARERDTPKPAASSVTTDSTASSSSQAATEATLTLTLVDKATGKSVANASVQVASNDGTLCKTSPCPANNKTWDGTSDAQGRVQLPADIVQSVITVSAVGYVPASYNYVTGTAQATIQLSRDENRAGY